MLDGCLIHSSFTHLSIVNGTIPKTGTDMTRLLCGFETETIPRTGTETARLRHGYEAETIPKTGTETARLRHGYETETIPKIRPDHLSENNVSLTLSVHFSNFDSPLI